MAAGLGTIAFLTVVGFRSQPADPQTRLPRRYRLADLIEQRQTATADLRRQVTQLRLEVDRQRAASASRLGGASARQTSLRDAGLAAGLTPLRGPAVKVTLDDSDLDQPPDGASVNDLVVHSQDVQAVVNALWRAGAEAMSINGQRLVSTSAVLCVGNTLLLNGTVHSPPYVVTAIGANRDRFDADRLVRRLKSTSSTFGVRFAVERASAAEVPAYRGSLTLNYARPAA